MRWSISVGKVKGTEVRVHLTFFIFLVWLGSVAYFQAGAAAAAATVSFLVLLFLGVVLHEFGHILAARRFGVHTPEIILLPIGGISRLERIPERPHQELLMALAGPAVTLVIALSLILALGGLPSPETVFDEVTPRAVLAQLAYANIVLFAFNLIPAFPLDGGRVLRAVLAHFKGHLRATELAATIGRVAAVLFGLAALMMGNIILLLIAVFIFFAAGSEAGMARMREVMFNVPARDLMITQYRALSPEDRVGEAADELIRTSQTEFPVVDDDGRPVGLLGRDSIIRALKEKGPDSPVGGSMESDIPSVGERHRLHDGLELLQGGAPAIAVTDKSGRLVGFVTLDNLLEKLMIARARGGEAGRAALVRR